MSRAMLFARSVIALLLLCGSCAAPAFPPAPEPRLTDRPYFRRRWHMYEYCEATLRHGENVAHQNIFWDDVEPVHLGTCDDWQCSLRVGPRAGHIVCTDGETHVRVSAPLTRYGADDRYCIEGETYCCLQLTCGRSQFPPILPSDPPVGE